MPECPMDFKAQPSPEPIPHLSMFDAMMAWENGNISEGEAIYLFQTLVNNGMAWTLQGMYGRQAKRMLDAGLIHPNA